MSPTRPVILSGVNDDEALALCFLCCGGGHQILAIDLEGTEVCRCPTSRGITCVLLKHRVPHSGPQWNKECNCQKNPKTPMALEDAQRTLGPVRLRAAEWHIDPHKVGVLGFSAGGHPFSHFGFAVQDFVLRRPRIHFGPFRCGLRGWRPRGILVPLKGSRDKGGFRNT
jgi:BD-FAE